MSKYNSFYEIAIRNALKQTAFIDALTEEAPIVSMMPSEATSDGLVNVYEELVAADEIGLVDFDAALPEVDSDTQLKQVDLSKLGAIMRVGEDKAKKMGGVQAYFAKKILPILRVTFAALETSVYYNSLRNYAIAQGKYQSAGGSGSVNYSITCVKWVPGETTGLYDEEGFGNGKVIDIKPLHGGNLHELTTGVPGYTQRLASYFGVQTANPRNVSAIVNIDPAEAEGVSMVTEAQMDKMLVDTRANSANTFLYMHPTMLTKLYAFKSAKLQLSVMDTDYNRMFDMWNGIRIITSYNIKDATETTVS